MEKISDMPILVRTGRVLIAIGIIDIGYMIYCIAMGIAYSSSFNIFAIIAGVFLVRGNLTAVSIVRWLSAFFLCGLVAMLVAWPFMQPLDLTFTQARLDIASTLINLVFLALLGALLFWLTKSLGHPSVLEAYGAAGRKQPSIRAAGFAGVAIILVLGFSVPLLLDGETGQKAKLIAQQELGPGYKFHVSSLNIASSSEGTSVRGVVTAWNSVEVRTVPVAWQER